jgi:hypothetical protein
MTLPPWRRLRVRASSGSSFTVAKKHGDDVWYGEYSPRKRRSARKTTASNGKGYPAVHNMRLGDEKPTASEAIGCGAFFFVVVHGDGAGAREHGGGRRFWRRWRKVLAEMCGEEAARGV